MVFHHTYNKARVAFMEKEKIEQTEARNDTVVLQDNVEAPMISIVVIQYNPEYSALERTLLSILLQDTQDFELIISDDGSTNNFFPETQALLKKYERSNVQFLLQKSNHGTVYNVWNAAFHATGKWIYCISPGDYLYDAGTIRWMKETAMKDDVQVAFGRAAYYVNTPYLHQVPGETPYKRDCYRKRNYQKHIVKRNLLLYDDGISGACVFYRKDLLLEALTLMKGRIRYAEDLALRMFAVQEIPILGYERLICWYEDGTGISTNPQHREKILKDWQAMLILLKEQFPKDLFVLLANAYFFNEKRKSRLLRGIVGHLIVPQWLPFKRKQKDREIPIRGHLTELKKLYELQRKEKKND